jgi:hypothetical protein
LRILISVPNQEHLETSASVSSLVDSSTVQATAKLGEVFSELDFLRPALDLTFFSFSPYSFIRLTYQLPVSSTFLSEQTSHQQPASSTFLSEQTSTSHQPPGKRTCCLFGVVSNICGVILFF